MNLQLDPAALAAELLPYIEEFIQKTPEWIDLRKASELKGIPYGTLSTCLYLQPKGGQPDEYQGRKKYWTREAILGWLPIMDHDLEEYLNQYGILLPSRYRPTIERFNHV